MKKQKKITARQYHLMSNAVNTFGTFDPDEIMFMFEESLYCDSNESELIYDFLKYLHENKLAFGSGNYNEVYKEYLKATGPTLKEKVKETPTKTVPFGTLTEVKLPEGF